MSDVVDYMRDAPRTTSGQDTKLQEEKNSLVWNLFRVFLPPFSLRKLKEKTLRCFVYLPGK